MINAYHVSVEAQDGTTIRGPVDIGPGTPCMGTGEIIITPPSIWNNKNSRKISGRILRIIRRQEKFSFGDFENNKSPPQAKIF